MSGTGKSTVVRELVERGYKAVDADDGFTEPLADGRQRWHEDAVRELLATEDAPFLFFAGCEDNMVGFLRDFDRVILLSAPVKTLVERVTTRTNNPYGSRPRDLERILQDVETVEPHLRAIADHEVDTMSPVDEVVAEVLRAAGAS
jgi:dephospho-CoA kinase